MTDDQQPSDDATVNANAEPSSPAHGNLFSQPRLTALDPIDANERKEVERLLESAGSDAA